MKRIIHTTALLVIILITGQTRAQVTSTDFTVQMVGPWTVHFEKEISKHDTGYVKQATDLLRVQLYEIVNILPAAALEKLKVVPVWVFWNERSSARATAEYIPVGDNSRPDIVHSVWIPNILNYFDGSLRHQRQVLLHELAHAYYDLCLGDGVRSFRRAYEAANDSKRYDSVLWLDGRHAKAYGMTNEWEYFATSTTAYFTMNEHYPFVRSELREFDPDMFNLLAKAWSSPDEFAKGDTLRYTKMDIDGWTVFTNAELDGDTVTRNSVTDVLRSELLKIMTSISPRALGIIRTVPIYIESETPRNHWHHEATFHPGMDWLTTHGLDPRWAGSVQIVNSKNFLEAYKKREEVIALLFADAYNSKALGFRDKHLAHLFSNANAERKYIQVLSKFKREDRSPAANNERAYFQQLSATFIRGASYFPFTKDKLKDYDPDMYNFLHECWEQ
jgi:hypothetical protein